MHRSKLIFAEHNRKKLIHELENTFRVPGYMANHTNMVIEDYKDIIHDLLKENKKLREDNNLNDPEEGYFLTK